MYGGREEQEEAQIRRGRPTEQISKEQREDPSRLLEGNLLVLILQRLRRNVLGYAVDLDRLGPLRGSIGRRLLLDVSELLPELIDLAPQCTESIRVVASVISRHGGTDGQRRTRTRNALYRRATSQNLPHRAPCWRLDSVCFVSHPWCIRSAIYCKHAC